jgi:hypothetical protein
VIRGRSLTFAQDMKDKQTDKPTWVTVIVNHEAPDNLTTKIGTNVFDLEY